MMDDAGFKAVLFGFLTLFVSGLMAMAIHRVETFRQEAVDRGFAQYNSTTGEWEWKEPEE